MKSILTPLLSILILVFFSCKRQGNLEISNFSEKELIDKATIKEKREYRVKNLEKIGKSLAVAIRKEPELLAFIYKEAKKQFDGDYNVLIKTLIKTAEYGNDFKSKEFIEGYEAFQNLSGVNWEPQIYIPRLSYLSENNIQLRTTDYEEPVYAIFDGDDNVNELPGYYLTEDGNFVLADSINIDEEYFENHDVFVLGLNETIYSEDNVLPNRVDSTNCYEIRITARIANMTIKDHKESIFAGKSDVNIIRKSRWSNPQGTNPVTGDTKRWSFEKVTTQSSNGFSVCDVSNFGTPIRKFTRKEVRNQTSVTISWSYYTKWSPYCGSPSQPYTNNSCNVEYDVMKGDALYYVIFECDPWPAPTQTARTPNPITGIVENEGEVMLYNSEQAAYYHSYINFALASQTQVVNSPWNLNINQPWIKFNSTATEFR